MKENELQAAGTVSGRPVKMPKLTQTRWTRPSGAGEADRPEICLEGSVNKACSGESHATLGKTNGKGTLEDKHPSFLVWRVGQTPDLPSWNCEGKVLYLLLPP